MRRKAGALVPLERSILVAAVTLHADGVEEFHGYQIAKHMADIADRRRLTAYGTLYRALGRLEGMGLLKSHWEDPQIAADENRPGRRLYALAGEGATLARASGGAQAERRPQRGHRRVAPA
jgi:DNA-binding PadR family transcriptional regulator